MISIDNYRRPGGGIDWKAYHQARVDAGEDCRRCGAIIILSHGHASLCGSCKQLDGNPAEVCHSSIARCPNCAHTFRITTDFESLFCEGEHDIDCPQCEREFVVSTTVHYTFTSPPLAAASPEEVAGG